MKTTEYEFNGQTYHLFFNSAVMFDCFDKFGNNDIFTAICEMTPESFNNLCWLIGKMSEQGALLRNYQGYEQCGTLNADELKLTMGATEFGNATEKAAKAVSLGFGRTTKDDEPQDPWLAEIEQKKTEKPRARNGFIRLIKCFIFRLKKLFCYRRA